MSTTVSSFRVIATVDHGTPVHCSHCARGMKHVVVLPLTSRPELDEGNLWVGLCAYCVLAMAKALAAAEGQTP